MPSFSKVEFEMRYHVYSKRFGGFNIYNVSNEGDWLRNANSYTSSSASCSDQGEKQSFPPPKESNALYISLMARLKYDQSTIIICNKWKGKKC